MSELTAIQERLAKLEKQVHQGRRMVAVSAILGGLAIVGLLYQWFKPGETKDSNPALKLQAESFTLVSASGPVRGQCPITAKCPAYMMPDQKHVERVPFTVIPPVPSVFLQDLEGHARRR